ncbi:MAG TPA: hypothetical protein ENH46_05670 [Candidatus Pacearchaeota archaeon]|nr:hypothetical protein [Candidatus Pacearchaeota archaeon]
MPKNKKPKLINGTKYNRLTILSYSHSDKRWRKFYEVRCECGNKKVILGSALVSGNTKSCGCLSLEVKKNKRLSENHTEITAIILGYKRHAKDRGLKWNLPREFIENIIKKECYYCGTLPNNRKITKNSLNTGLLYSGIDRLNSVKDYTKENVVPCCKICNNAKSNMDIKSFKNWVIKIGKKAMAQQWSEYLERQNKLKEIEN